MHSEILQCITYNKSTNSSTFLRLPLEQRLNCPETPEKELHLARKRLKEVRNG